MNKNKFINSLNILIFFLLVITIETQSLKDPFKILGVKNNANQKQIKKAFRELSIKYHPDKNPQGGQKFKEILLAYQTLKENNFKYSPNSNYFSFKRQNFDDMNNWQTFTNYYGDDFQEGVYFVLDINQYMMDILKSEELKNFFKEAKYDQEGNKVLQDCFGFLCWCHKNPRVYLAAIIFFLSSVMIIFSK